MKKITCEHSGIEFESKSQEEMKWISVKDELPKHHQIILVFDKTNIAYGVATFVDSIKMNDELSQGHYANECVDVSKNPHYFVSQEIKRHTFKTVSHWMHLPEPPK